MAEQRFRACMPLGKEKTPKRGLPVQILSGCIVNNAATVAFSLYGVLSVNTKDDFGFRFCTD